MVFQKGLYMEVTLKNKPVFPLELLAPFINSLHLAISNHPVIFSFKCEYYIANLTQKPGNS